MIEIGTGEFRISVFEIPLAIAGIIGGPIWGFFVAFCWWTVYFSKRLALFTLCPYQQLFGAC